MPSMRLTTPRLMVAGLSGDSGKTLVSIGLVGALRARGVAVAGLKKGPDYIDAAWLGRAAGSAGRNLDTFLMEPAAIGEALLRGSRGAELLVVEGNRGFHDGFDARGSHSTAELAHLIGAPVILVVDVTKMTRTAAALIAGCAAFDARVEIAGVVLNRVATARQERVIRDAIGAADGPPVLGALPRLDSDPLPGRHLGLVTAGEHPDGDAAIATAASLVAGQLDMDAVIGIARAATPVELPMAAPVESGAHVTIGVFRGGPFSFYYPENLEALEQTGAELIDVEPLTAEALPAVDALYLGGGFPEVHAHELAGNVALRGAVRDAARSGMPIYAECGGLMYLCRELIVDGRSYPMAGVLDLAVEQTARPVGHGYVLASVERPNPFFPQGTRLRGHEFHYSRIVSAAASGPEPVLKLERGHGVGDRHDGLVAGRVWASYTHMHALGTPAWAPGFVALARSYRAERPALAWG